MANNSEAERTKLVTLSWEGNKNTKISEVITLPVPYELPPQRYSSEGYISLLLKKSCTPIYLNASIIFLCLSRHSVVMGPAIQQERCAWPSLAKTSSTLHHSRLIRCQTPCV